MLVAHTITPDSNHTAVENFAGFNLREDNSAAATINFREVDGSGQVLLTVNLAADESVAFVSPENIQVEGGVYVEEVAGSVTGVLYERR